MSQNIQIIDVGSSTVKCYRIEAGNILLSEQRSFHFKKYANADGLLSDEIINELLTYITELVEKNVINTKIIATGIFRKIPADQQQFIIDTCFVKTKCYFNIISHEMEGQYLNKALSAMCPTDHTVLLLNIGGGSTEIIIKQNNKPDVTVNVELGVGNIIEKFPGVNEETSTTSLDTVTEYIKTLLPKIDSIADYAIYNGGELHYMKLAEYNLAKNVSFTDSDHPLEISLKDFSQKNFEIFNSISLTSLEELMPNDPKWMHGARACSAIAQAVCEKYSVTKIIPSDSNTVHGYVRLPLRNVTLSGSYRKHLDYIIDIKTYVEKLGMTVLSPVLTSPKNPGETFVIFHGEEGLSPLALERKQLVAIKHSDALIVCCPGGYVGASALIEIGYALAHNKLVLYTETPDEFMLNTLPHEFLGYKKQPS